MPGLSLSLLANTLFTVTVTIFYSCACGLFLAGIDTDPLWRNVYVAHWPRKRKWPEIYFKTKGITREQECWRVYCLQRHLQEALNSYTATCMQSSSSSEGI